MRQPHYSLQIPEEGSTKGGAGLCFLGPVVEHKGMAQICTKEGQPGHERNLLYHEGGQMLEQAAQLGG